MESSPDNKWQELLARSDDLACDFHDAGYHEAAIAQWELTCRLNGAPHLAMLRNMANSYQHLRVYDKAWQMMEAYMAAVPEITADEYCVAAEMLMHLDQMDAAWHLLSPVIYQTQRTLMIASWHLHRMRQLQPALELWHQSKKGTVWLDDKQPPACDQWQGGPLEGKTICVVGEAGYGDEIIFSRWLPHLTSQARAVYYYTDNSLQGAICRNFGVMPHDDQAVYDHWVPSMSLPLLLKSTDLLPQAYITADPDHVRKWSEKLAHLDQFIAINWTGSAANVVNPDRSMPAKLMVQQLGGLAPLVSVCMGSDHTPEGVIDLCPDIETWDDTLAILHLSSACATICSSVAHASAALGRPTVVYAHRPDYFTWCSAAEGQCSDWYDSARVFRKTAGGDWQPALEHSRQALENLLRPS